MNPWGSKSAKRRDRMYIMAEVLEIAKDNALKTQIMYKAGLSFTQVNGYLKTMLEATLLKEVKENDRKIYSATMKGLDFLQRYREMAELLRKEKENCKINGKILPLHLLRNVKSVVYLPKNQ